MLPLLAAGDPFQHTWDGWVIEAYGLHFDLRSVPYFEQLGITKAVVMMTCAALIVLAIGLVAGKEARAANQEGRTAHGFGGLVETLVEWIRNDLMKPYMPHHYQRPWFNALICTFFFFILTCNLIGLMPPPFGFTATGVPWVPCGLAFGVTFTVMVFAGMAEHGGPHRFAVHLAPPSPWWVRWPLLLPLESVGLLIKPFALTIRLTANMMAGHIILAVLMGFLTTTLSVAIAAMVYPVSAAGVAAITIFEIVIAGIQAYIFTILSCVFIGQSVSHEH